MAAVFDPSHIPPSIPQLYMSHHLVELLVDK